MWVWPGDPERQHESRPPRTPEVADDGFETISSGPMQVPANYLLLVENLLDISHFYPLHDGNIGDVANSRIPVKLEEGEVDGNRYVKTIREVESYTQPPFLADWFGYDVVDRHHTHCMVSPGLTRVQMRVAPPGQLGTEAERGYVLMHTHTPVDGTNHVWRWIVSFRAGLMSRGDPTVSAAQRFGEMFPAVAAEDLWALEKQQQMFDFPDEGYTEVHLRPDKALRRARQIFSALLRKERESRRGCGAEGGGRPARTERQLVTAVVAYTRRARSLQATGCRATGLHLCSLHHRAFGTDGKRMTMTPEAWTVIGTGVVILIAIATSNRQLRSEMKAFREEVRAELNQVHGEIGRLRERMAKLEGLLEGLREAITGRKAA